MSKSQSFYNYSLVFRSPIWSNDKTLLAHSIQSISFQASMTWICQSSFRVLLVQLLSPVCFSFSSISQLIMSIPRLRGRVMSNRKEINVIWLIHWQYDIRITFVSNVEMMRFYQRTFWEFFKITIWEQLESNFLVVLRWQWNFFQLDFYGILSTSSFWLSTSLIHSLEITLSMLLSTKFYTST